MIFIPILRKMSESGYFLRIFSQSNLTLNPSKTSRVMEVTLPPNFLSPCAPLKVKFFLCTFYHQKLNENNGRQNKRPFSCLSSQWCSLCFANHENHCHPFVSCPCANWFWKKLWALFDRNDSLPSYWFEVFEKVYQM